MERDFSRVFGDELAAIQKRKPKRKADELVGLAFSGGSVRSASFCLGVVEALFEKKKFEDIDYLSTISGGSYAGASLSWFLRKKNPAVLNFSRTNGSYLVPGKGIDGLSIVATLLRSHLVAFAVYFPLLCLFMYLVQPLAMGWMLVGLFGIFIGISFMFSLLTAIFSNDRTANWFYRLRTGVQSSLGLILKLVGWTIAIWSIKPLLSILTPHGMSGWVGGLLAMLGYIGMSWSVFRGVISKITVSTIPWVLSVAAHLFVYGLLILACIVLEQAPEALWGMLSVSLLLGFFANINVVGGHRMYRDRLMESFMPDVESAEKDEWSLAQGANNYLLVDIPHDGPFHIFGTTACFDNSSVSKIRNREGESFTMTSLYCGCPSTGWEKTSKYMKGTVKVATAMAISGAALGPGIWPSNTPWVSFLMTFLGLRLGFWAPNPKHSCRTPNYFIPGLLDLFGFGHRESSPFIELADGGLFDNSGLYELIRRKVKVAIVCTAAPDAQFGDIDVPIELVRMDFGVEITFDDPNFDLTGLMPGSAPSNFKDKTLNLCRNSFAIGTIHYPDGMKGKIYYLKASMVDGLPSDVYGYCFQNPAFPYDPLVNQECSEREFESYRELGYHQMLRLLEKL